jgi:hypothetical protein
MRCGIVHSRCWLEWWKKNGVYSIYIVLEARLFDALRMETVLLGSARFAGA